MSLDRNSLRTALLAMMRDAEAGAWTKEQVADAMSTAIDSYVRAGAVRDVVVALPGGEQARQTGSVGLR